MSRDPTPSDGSSPEALGDSPPDALAPDPLDAPLSDVSAAELRLQDGIASEADRLLLQHAGLSAASLRSRQQRLTALLLPQHPAPELVPQVLRSLEISWVDSATALLDGSEGAPEMSVAVLDSLELAVVRSHDALLEGSGGPPELAATVLQETGLPAIDSQSVLLQGAGDAPELAASVSEPLALSPIRSADALLEGSGPSPDLLPGLETHPELPLAASHTAAALWSGAEPAPDVVQSVLERSTRVSQRQVTENGVSHVDLRELLVGSSPEAPDLSASILASLDLADAPPVGAVLRDGAGPVPDLAGNVLASLGLSSSESDAPEAAPAVPPRVVPLHPARPAVSPPSAPHVPAAARRWGVGRWAMVGLPVVAMAAAAVLFLMQAVVQVAPTEQLIAFSADVVNQIEIEDITTDVAAVVHVMPGDIDDLAAPTIIFIDVLDDDDDAPMPVGKGRKL